METELHTSLIKVVGVDNDKCVNCHACITACPVKFCNDGSGDHVTVNQDMCIACGNCIKACTHDARFFIDDFDVFMKDAESGLSIVAIVAPSVAANFPENYLNINGWLKELGVEAVFDVSFGAELTVKSYLEHLKNNKPELIIAQPCPAIVTYIELYQPELLKYLAPADSPMLHTMKMIKTYYPQYKEHKIAVISPCNAKKREYEETRYGDYNIAYISIDNYFKEKQIELKFFPEIQYDNPPAERAVLFSSPGGLLQTAERWMPEIRYSTRKIEGHHVIYDYLKQLPQVIKEGKAPKLIDCLNCDYGCNGGPLTIAKDKPQDEVEYWINQRNLQMQEAYKKKGGNMPDTKEIEETVNKYWQEGLYDRTYENLWQNVSLKYPDEAQLKEIYKTMHKFTDEDLFNCSACGYGSCKDMAIAIFNDLNRPDNCHFYLLSETEISHKEALQSEKRLQTILDTMQDGFIRIDTNGLVINVNPAMRRILKRNDVIGRTLFDFLDDENASIVRKQMEKRARNEHNTYELAFNQSDGNQVYTLVSASPMYNENKQRIGSFAMISDITAIKDAEDELKKANEELEDRVRQRTAELQEMVEELRTTTEIIEENNKQLEKLSIVAQKTDNAILLMDPSGNLEWMNDGFSKLYGYNLESFREKFGENIIDCSSYPEIREAMKRCLVDKETVIYESSTRLTSGGKKWAQTTLTPILDDSGRIIRLVAIDSDISKLKKAEEEILQQQEEILSQSEQLEESLFALKESEQKLYDIIDFLPDPVLVIDNEGKVIAWNKSIQKMSGIKADDMLEKGNYEYALPFYGKRRPILVDLVSLPDSEFEEKYATVEKHDDFITGETYVENLGGQARYLLGTAAPLFNALGEKVGAIELIKDITERKKAEEELQKQKEEITEKSVQMSELVEELKLTSEIIEDYNIELEKLSIVASQTDNAIIIMDNEGNFEWINEGYTKMYGYEFDDLIEIKGNNIAGKSAAKQTKLAFKTCIKENHSVIYESMNQTKEGENIWTQTTLTPIFDEDGKLNKLVAIESDISELKRAEQEILHQKEEIESQRDEIERQRDLATAQRDLLKKQKKDITDSIQYASRIQNALLPPEENFADVFDEHFVYYKPRDIVSGDYFWMKTKGKIAMFAVADCTGHGVPGAFMSLLGIAFLNEISNRIFSSGENIEDISASTILNELRKQVKLALRQSHHYLTAKDGMDMAFFIYNPNKKELQYSGAYNPMYLIRDNKLEHIKADKMPIGIYIREKDSFTNHTIQLQKGDRVYAFSDGYYDQFGGINGRKYYSKKFKELLLSNSRLPMSKQRDILENTMKNWRRHPETKRIYDQVDDMLVVGIKI